MKSVKSIGDSFDFMSDNVKEDLFLFGDSDLMKRKINLFRKQL